MPEPAIVTRIRTEGGPRHDLLVVLDQHRILTTAQLARATGASERTVRSRLDRLREAKLIDAARLDRVSGSGPWHWWLRLPGARLVAGAAVAQGQRAPSGGRAAHAAAIAEVWLALREHGSAAGIELNGWRSDRAAWQEWEPTGRYRRSRLTPDALARLRLAGADRDAPDLVGFVEVDLSWMSETALREKVLRYLVYVRDRAWVGVYPHCPALLLLTTAEARAATFLRAAGRLIGADPSAGELVLVAACDYAREPHRAVREACWAVPGPVGARLSLAELLGERVAAAAAAGRDGDALAAASDREDQVWWLSRAATSRRAEAQLADDAATEALRYLAADPAGYDAGRDRAVAARIRASGWRARRRADPAQLAAAHDAVELLVCDTCGPVLPASR